jgi:hypothetical protein
MDSPGPHGQYKCNSGGGCCASIIVHKRFANRVTFNTCGTNWVVIGLDFSELGWKDIGFVSAHLPPEKQKHSWTTRSVAGPLLRSMQLSWL